ncbi:hypothetical protein M3Y99_01049000 [Aphelenchoides fujianensis]|nr:hypothetical protein M3Y99_01049000 [Aphelenchoides fujianensis]
MEAPFVEPRPRHRAVAVRDGLNRFLQIHAMRTDEKKAPLQLARLAAVSRAQLVSVRRHVPVLKFTLWPAGWAWFMPNVGLGSTAGRIYVSATETSGIAKLLRVPIRLVIVNSSGLEHVDWKEMRMLEEWVNGLEIHESEALYQFPLLSGLIDRVTPQLKNLMCSAAVLDRFPPLDLDSLDFRGADGLHDAVSRHTIRRLDVNTFVASRESSSDQLFSASIESLGLVEYQDLLSVRPETVVAFCRRFPGLEELRFVVVYQFEPSDAEDPFFKQLWDGLLQLRERLNISGLKRLYFEIEYLGYFHDDNPGWIDRLKQTEPLNKAAFSSNPSTSRLCFSLKLSWPRDALPTFFRILGEFQDVEDESDEMRDGSLGIQPFCSGFSTLWTFLMTKWTTRTRSSTVRTSTSTRMRWTRTRRPTRTEWTMWASISRLFLRNPPLLLLGCSLRVLLMCRFL